MVRKACWQKWVFQEKKFYWKKNLPTKKFVKKNFTENKIVEKDLPKKTILKEFIAKKSFTEKKILPKKDLAKAFLLQKFFFPWKSYLRFKYNLWSWNLAFRLNLQKYDKTRSFRWFSLVDFWFGFPNFYSCLERKLNLH